MDTIQQLKYDAHVQHVDPPSLMPALPGHEASPFSYANRSNQNSHIHIPISSLTADNLALQHQHIERAEPFGADNDNPLDFPNAWCKIRYEYREYFAEFFGTMLMICFGNGVNCQVVLSGLEKGNYLSINVGWGVGVMVGVYVAGGISGGHLNPVVTLALAGFRGFSWRKLPGFAAAQIFGAFIGSLIIQALYSGAIDAFEGGSGVRTFGGLKSTGALFFTAPSEYASNAVCFFSEYFNTAVLLIVVLAIGDKNNLPPPLGLAPVVLFFLILGIGAALGWNTAYCLNPARDLGPRLAALAGGFSGQTIFTAQRLYWIWTPIIATSLGGISGALVYDVFLYTGTDSWVNKPWGNMHKSSVSSIGDKLSVSEKTSNLKFV